MSIPELNADGFLPPGIHDCSLKEIGSRFGVFCRSNRRIKLCRQLEGFVEALSSTGFATALLVDGSFVTAKEEPGDIDLVIVLRRDHDFDRELRPFEYNVLSKKRVRRQYGFDTLVAVEETPELGDAADFFQQVRSKSGVRKGILRIEL